MQKRLCKLLLAVLALLLVGCTELPQGVETASDTDAAVTMRLSETLSLPETTAVPETVAPPVTTEAPETEAPPKTEETTLGADASAAPTDTTAFTPAAVAEEPSLRRVENFIFFETDTPEYRLAELLYLEIPPVLKTEEVTETVASESSAAPESSETTEKAPADSTVPTETTVPPVTVTYEVEGRAALYYQDLESGEAFAFAPDERFFCASMIKAVYVYALMQLAEAGEIDLAEEIVYTADMLIEGSGNFAKVEDGKRFTVKSLISHTIRYSDNTAFSMLQTRFGTAFFAGIMERDGLSPTRFGAWWRTTARSYGAFFVKLYAYFAAGSENALWLCEEMKHSTQTVMLQRALSPDPVAHKYGWDEDSYCDGGVVLAEHPYIVVFLSNLDEGHLKRANTQFIYAVGAELKAIHDAQYPAVTTEDPSA